LKDSDGLRLGAALRGTLAVTGTGRVFRDPGLSMTYEPETRIDSDRPHDSDGQPETLVGSGG
jgi:hypothetical protein